MVHYRQKEGISIMARSDGYNTKTRQLILDYLIRNRQHAVSASNILEHLEAEGASMWTKAVTAGSTCTSSVCGAGASIIWTATSWTRCAPT